MLLIHRGEEGKALRDSIMVETDLFERREVKPHFINPCCFGEDFAAWLKEQLSPLVDSGFTLLKITQEDYGWGFWVWHGKDPSGLRFHMSVTNVKNRQPRWVISVNYGSRVESD